MTTLQRITVPMINAIFVTMGLLYLMFLLIKSDEPELSTTKGFVIPPFDNVREDPDLITGIQLPPPPAPVDNPPEIISDDPFIPDQKIVADIGPGYEIPKQIGGIRMPEDNQLVLALGYPPQYPTVAIAREIEGFAVVGFSVSESGSVFDPYIMESEPGSVFDRSALKAISKFKYKARVVGGKSVSTDGQRYMFTYKLDD